MTVRTQMIVPDGASSSGVAAMGTSTDRGCPACSAVIADGDQVIFDTRGRYWHLHCTAAVLGGHTRRGETRAHARYRWHFDDKETGR